MYLYIQYRRDMDLIITSWILVLTAVVALWIKFRKERFSIFKRNGIPGPEPNFWTGNLKDIVEKREDCVFEYVRKYGNIVGIFVGAKPFVIVTDKELIKLIQVKEFAKFTNRHLILEDVGMPQPEILQSMGSSRDEEWRKKRNLVSPSFSTSRLKKLMPIFNEASAIFMDKIGHERRKGYINIVKFLRNLTLDIITKSALGIDTRAQHTSNTKLLQSTRLFLTTDISEILPQISLCFPELEPLPTKLRQIRDSLKYVLGLPSVKTVMKNVKEVMDYRREHSQRREDILQNLMEEKAETKSSLSSKNEDLPSSKDNKEASKTEYESLSDDSIVGTAAILVVAGFDTTSLTISHLIHYLTIYPEIQDKLREEIKDQIGEKNDVEYEDLFNLPYLDQVISETLRLHSTNMLNVTRVAKESYEYNGMTIPKGSGIIIPTHYMQRNPDNWTDPDKFCPDRFSPENKGTINPSIYQPFGNGPRNCVGLRFAQVVMKLVVARLINTYKLEGQSRKDMELEHAIFLSQPKEVVVKLEPIHSPCYSSDTQ